MFLRYSLFRKKKIVIYLLILAAFSTFINYYYANLGVFPPDSFCHFDNGFRILLGEHPFKDYWVVSGPIIDYLQAIFFYVFGVSWNSYLIHASVFNLILCFNFLNRKLFSKIRRALIPGGFLFFPKPQQFFLNYKEFFRVGAGLKPTVLLALILISSPVCGFRPFLAFRDLTVNVPKLG